MALHGEQRTGEMASAWRWAPIAEGVAHGAKGRLFPDGHRIAIGIPAAIGAGKLMTQQLFSVRPWDPVMLASATLAL